MFTEQFISCDDSVIKYYKWMPESEPKAVIQISHGMMEHALRYEYFAQKLTDAGFAVYANDHRGHGKTAGNIEYSGFFCSKNGWNNVVDDMFQLNNIIKKDFPEKKIILFGHSMGSLLSRHFAFKYPNAFDGLILSGTGYNPSILVNSGKILASIVSLFKGNKYRSKLLHKLSILKYNENFKPVKTDFDWLSRDEKEVEKYIKDNFCGFVCTTSFYKDLFFGIKQIQKKKNIDKMNKKTPLLIVSGEKDAVGDFSNGVRKVKKAFEKANIENITLKLYPNNRHELINEYDKNQFIDDILRWIKNEIKALN